MTTSEKEGERERDKERRYWGKRRKNTSRTSAAAVPRNRKNYLRTHSIGLSKKKRKRHYLCKYHNYFYASMPISKALRLLILRPRMSPTSETTLRTKSRSSLVCDAETQKRAREATMDVAGKPTTTTAKSRLRHSREKALEKGNHKKSWSTKSRQ